MHKNKHSHQSMFLYMVFSTPKKFL